MPDQPETTRLTDAERGLLRDRALWSQSGMLFAAVEQIIAARLAPVNNLVRAAEYQQSTTLSRDFNGRPFEPSITLSSLRAAVSSPPEARA